MDTVSASVFEALCVPGEFFLLFGTARSNGADPEALPASLATRIVLSPYVAKRFAILLNNKVHEYESRYGTLTEVAATSSSPPEKPLLHDDIPRYASGITAEKANSLLRLIGSLGIQFGMERSFKMSDRSLLMNRFIIGFRKDDLPQNPDETLISIFMQMGMPGRFQEDCKKQLHKTYYVHFGFEEQHDGCLYKAYLEFKTTPQDGPDCAGATQEPFLVFLGFKWNPCDNGACAVTRYICHPLLSPEEIREKLSCLFDRNPGYKSFETAEKILDKAVTTISNNEIVYEEVSEENNPRKSFDMNLYGANLHIRDIRPFLVDIARHYSLPDDLFVSLCDRIGDKTFGHLSGGIDRCGKDFLTVYYGVEGVDNRSLPACIYPGVAMVSQ